MSAQKESAGAPESNTAPGQTMTAEQIVNEYLRLVMIPEPEQAARLVSDQMTIHFTGNRLMHKPADCTAFNAGRYKWVKKSIESTETVAGGTDEHTVVYSLGTLYGEWPDGTPFEGNRYVDRYIVSHGLITELSVWNDSAERLMVMAGLIEP